MRLLVLSYFHPPFPQAGGSRWASMARWLRRDGHDVTVVTTVAHGRLPTDAAEHVVRTGDLAAVASLRRALRRPELEHAAGGAPPALLSKVLVPDAHLVSWLPAAVRALRRELRRGAYDCVVTSGPPDSSHLAGLLLGRDRPPWIAEFRDGWVFEPPREPFPTAPQRALERRLEAVVVKRADAVVAATRPVAEDFRRRYGVPADWVPNGWDPDLAPDVVPERREGVTLVHTGTLRGSWGRDPGPLLAALERVAAEAGPPLRLVLAGRRDAADERPGVEHLGLVPRERALALQRGADALLLLTSPNTGEATGKLFEYLAAGRPILALAAGNEAARIVTETGTGLCADPADVDAIAAALRRVRAGGLPYAAHDVERYAYPGPARALAAVAERLTPRPGLPARPPRPPGG